MMKYLLIVSFGLFSIVALAQEKAQAYINTYKNIAIAEMQRTGVPASITLAQGLIESGCGEGDLCKMSNNHFGIKCKTEWTGGKVYHDDDSRQECFRSYLSGADSYKDHSDFLRTREPYAFLFKIDPSDYIGWAKGLKKAGYATEKDYPEKLIKVINDYNLNQYSILALNKTKSVSSDSSLVAKVVKSADSTLAETTLVFKTPSSNEAKVDTSVVTTTIIKDTVLGELVLPFTKQKDSAINVLETPLQPKEDSVVVINNNIVIESLKFDKVKSDYPKGVFSINHTKVIYVEEGTSLLSIANQNDIALVKLLEYNDMKEADLTTKPQLLFLERKQLKGNTDIHIVKPHEDLLDISQQEGVRLDKILEYNKLKKESIVNAGDKILLRPMATYGLSK